MGEGQGQWGKGGGDKVKCRGVPADCMETCCVDQNIS